MPAKHTDNATYLRDGTLFEKSFSKDNGPGKSFDIRNTTIKILLNSRITYNLTHPYQASPYFLFSFHYIIFLPLHYFPYISQTMDSLLGPWHTGRIPSLPHSSTSQQMGSNLSREKYIFKVSNSQQRHTFL